MKPKLAVWHNASVKVLSREDFDGYDYNNPGRYAGEWELVEFDDGRRVWVPRYALEEHSNDGDKLPS